MRLFGPEHGIRGDVPAGDKVGDSVDPRTGVTVTSLYGSSRRPSPESLEGVDVILFDIQDVGVRFYTYVWTMTLAMEACAAEGVGVLSSPATRASSNGRDLRMSAHTRRARRI